jgi:hypothetical protein
LIKTGMTQAFPVGGVGLDQGGDPEVAAEPMSEFGRTMAIEVPAEFRTPATPGADVPVAEADGQVGTRGAAREDSPWDQASPAGDMPETSPGFEMPDRSGEQSGTEETMTDHPPGDGFPDTARGFSGGGIEAESDPVPESSGYPATPPATETDLQTGAAGATEGIVLSQESIDSLARRVVEKLSDQIVREIAWEVVPDLAETLIRKRIQELEEKIDD